MTICPFRCRQGQGDGFIIIDLAEAKSFVFLEPSFLQGENVLFSSPVFVWSILFPRLRLCENVLYLFTHNALH